MSEKDMRSFISTLRRALLMIVSWCDEWLEAHSAR